MEINNEMLAALNGIVDVQKVKEMKKMNAILFGIMKVLADSSQSIQATFVDTIANQLDKIEKE